MAAIQITPVAGNVVFGNAPAVLAVVPLEAIGRLRTCRVLSAED
jgi:hypothetical protein